ncbi:MAG: hypothetical protein AAGB31_10700 [Bdellovibrio sp.]
MKAMVRIVFLMAALILSEVAHADPHDPRQPSPWSDIVWKGYYYLTSDLVPADDLAFPAGEKFEWISALGGGGYAPVNIFTLRPVHCETPERETEMVLLNPEGGQGTEVVVEMQKNCTLVFYVESHLMGTASFFTESTE